MKNDKSVQNDDEIVLAICLICSGWLSSFGFHLYALFLDTVV